MPRLFVGLEIPESLKTALILPRSGVQNARWQRDDQLHLTLAFIGDVQARDATDIEAELSRIQMIPFELALSGVGYFGKPKQPKALWAGVEDARPLRHLHEKITYAMERIGMPVDQRRFLPHVTLARFRRGATAKIGNWVGDNERLQTHREWIHHFTLFSSHLTEERAHYRVEAQYGSTLSLDLGDEDWWDYENETDTWADGGSVYHQAAAQRMI